MVFKERTESNLLKCLRILNLRMELTEDEKKYYINLKKGYEGEVKFEVKNFEGDFCYEPDKLQSAIGKDKQRA